MLLEDTNPQKEKEGTAIGVSCGGSPAAGRPLPLPFGKGPDFLRDEIRPLLNAAEFGEDGFDDRSVGVAGRRMNLRGRGYDDAIDRYEVKVEGGANNLSVDEWRVTKERGWSTPA